MTDDFAELNIKGKTYKLPIQKASIGHDVIDVTNLYKETGYFTYDPGFMSTGSCRSNITYIDGDKGILRHRGYEIGYLAENHSFLDVSYLLLNGELPSISESKRFTDDVTHHTMVSEQMRDLYSGFRHEAHPMAVMLSAVGSLSAIYHEEFDLTQESEREEAAIKILAKMPTLAAMTYKYSISQPFIYPDNDLSFTENFLKMMFATPCEKYVPSKTLAKALDQIFILHADHEQNASTSTVRIAGSSGANPYACISAGIASLWGKAHGGANEAVIKTLQEIGHIDNVPEYIEKVKDKSSGVRLMGFGHRVYKNYDPRATALKDTCKEVLDELDQKDNNLLEIAVELERIALNDEYFVERKLFPNVDFYSGIIYQAMGIPTKMFTVLFAVARTIGWMAQWKEMLEDPEQKINRPRQLYTGEVLRKPRK